jgi:hypothetical protein
VVACPTGGMNPCDAAPGTYNFTLTVFVDGGQSVSRTATLTVLQGREPNP